MNKIEFNVVKNTILKLLFLFKRVFVVFISDYVMKIYFLETKCPNIDTIISKHSTLNS